MSTTISEETCFDGLLGCHARIRHFIAVSRKIADAEGQPLADIAGAAESVHRYFTVALPLHEADENNSIHPRLQKLIDQPDLSVASARMVHQHKDINAVIKRLIPIWDLLRGTPEELANVVVQLRHDSEQLKLLFDTHLRLEEEVVFPAMRRHLPHEGLEAIRREMQQRRA